MKTKFIALLLCTAMLLSLAPAAMAAEDEAAETRRLIELVNDYWIGNHPNPPGCSWDEAAYFVGNTAAYLATGIESYREYGERWGEANRWQGDRGNSTNAWTNSGVYHADNQTCFQTYADLYFLDGDEAKIARALEVMDAQISTGATDYWWWCDAVFMAMPAMTRLYRITGDERYADRLYDYFNSCRSALYDSEYHLFFRDSGYIGSRVEGQKNFWARGNGWVMAALAQVLRDMPENWKHYYDILAVYREMAAGAAACMKDDGRGNMYWTQSMLPKYPVSVSNPDGYETSGTAFMTYALMYGINAGLLDEAVYLPYAMGGISYLKNVAIADNGRVGYVQPIGSAATYATERETTQNFGVGATLLALCELYKYQGGLSQTGGLNYSSDLLPYLTWKLNNTVAIHMTTGNILANGKVYSAPAPLYDEVYLPLRGLAEALGYTVEWDQAGYASVYKDGRSLIFTPGSSYIRINGVNTLVSGPVTNVGGTMYIEFSTATLAFRLHGERRGDIVLLGRKHENFLSCETAVEQLLNEILTTGALPARAAQAEKEFVSTGEFTPAGAGNAFEAIDIDTSNALPIVRAAAISIPEPENPPANAYDGNLATRYAAIGFDAVFDLGEVHHVDNIALSFWQYDVRTTGYELSVSADGENYTKLFDGRSTQGQVFDRHEVGTDVRYVRVVGHGNTFSDWTSLLEILIYGE